MVDRIKKIEFSGHGERWILSYSETGLWLSQNRRILIKKNFKDIVSLKKTIATYVAGRRKEGFKIKEKI